MGSLGDYGMDYAPRVLSKRERKRELALYRKRGWAIPARLKPPKEGATR